MLKPHVHPSSPLPDHPLFGLNPTAWASVSSTLHQRVFAHGESILHHGDPANQLWLVFRGWVKLARQTPDGKETIVGLCTQGDVFGKAALFNHANYPYHAEVVSADAVLAAIPAPQLRALVEQDHDISKNIMNLMNERASLAQLKLEQLNTMSAAQRLGCFLLNLCHSHSENGKRVEIPISKNILASYLGMKPETFSRSLQQLKPLGISTDGAYIDIANISKLRGFVCHSCSGSGECDIEADAE